LHALATVVASAVSAGHNVRARWLAFGAPEADWSPWEDIAAVTVAGRSVSAGGSAEELDNVTLVFARAVEERMQAHVQEGRCVLQWVKQGSPVEIVAASAIDVVAETPGATCTITLRDLGDPEPIQARNSDAE
jgi:hypothetical protein